MSSVPPKRPPPIDNKTIDEFYLHLELTGFAQRLIEDIALAGAFGFPRARVKRAVAALKVAKAHYLGTDAPNIKTSRAARIAALLDTARKQKDALVGKPTSRGTYTEAIAARRAARSIAHGILDDPEGLGRITVAEWTKAVVEWRGDTRRPPGNPHGSKVVYGTDIVFRLLRAHKLTGAKSAANVGKALSNRKRRAR